MGKRISVDADGQVVEEEFAPGEDVFDVARSAMVEADANTKEWQKKIVVGQYVLMNPMGFPIIGKIEKFPSEKGHELYPYATCYSIAEVFGEYGHVHLSTVVEILSEQRFNEELAKIQGAA